MSTEKPSPWQRLRSAQYGLLLALSEWTGRMRRPVAETPVGSLDALPPAGRARAEALAVRYAVCFEATLGAAAATQAYEYLDFIDQFVATRRGLPTTAPVVQDVGSGGFAYAPALVASLRPARLVGIEVEGYRRLVGRTNRAERVAALVSTLPGVEYRIADYTTWCEPADLVTAFFPFVTVEPVLGWRMPLRVLRPAALFARIRANLEPHGELWMVNHSDAEARVAFGYALAAGLRLRHEHRPQLYLRQRANQPVVSAWAPAPVTR